MLNRDKRSLILLLALGDGCLHYIKNNGSIYGGITISHGMKQADYQSWKAKLLSTIARKNVVVRPANKGTAVQVSLCMKRLRAWRKFTYPNNKKSIPKMLKFITHPELAMTVMFMDDGYVEVSNKVNQNGAKFRLFLCDQSINDLKLTIDWFKVNFNVDAVIKYQKQYPYLKFTAKDSLKMWEIMRPFTLTFKSMQYKFRFIEASYQFKFVQRAADNKKSEDIVRHS
jgi:hypothetical protein